MSQSDSTFVGPVALSVQHLTSPLQVQAVNLREDEHMMQSVSQHALELFVLVNFEAPEVTRIDVQTGWHSSRFGAVPLKSFSLSRTQAKRMHTQSVHRMDAMFACIQIFQ